LEPLSALGFGISGLSTPFRPSPAASWSELEKTYEKYTTKIQGSYKKLWIAAVASPVMASCYEAMACETITLFGASANFSVSYD
jgi:hypothetical protein